MRYRKTVKTNGVETARFDYVYSDGTLILLTYTANGVSNTARFVYDSWGEPRGFMLNDSATYLYLKNAQGDITGIVDETGAVLLTYSYTAWGEVSFTATDMDSLVLAGTLSNVNPFTYRGYCYDYDIDMYYLQSRYYDPEICRFINADSTDYLGATGTLLSYNLFAYCENDGVNRIDEEGDSWKTVYKSSKEIVKLSKKLKKKLANCADDIFQHVRDVVNIGYFERRNRKGYQAIYRKSYGIKESKLYNHCKSLYENARLYLMASYDVDIYNKKWHELSENQQLELLNTMPSWSKKVGWNVGKYYGFTIGKDVFITSCKVYLNMVKVK